VQQFDKLTSQAMATHMKKVEVVSIMRVKADKYSSLGDHQKALNYLKRVDDLALQLLPSQKHNQVILNKAKSVEILLRTKNNEYLEQASKCGEEAYELALALYGKLNIRTNHIMMTYALALGRLEETKI
jgi:hypothetical protein